MVSKVNEDMVLLTTKVWQLVKSAIELVEYVSCYLVTSGVKLQ